MIWAALAFCLLCCLFKKEIFKPPPDLQEESGTIKGEITHIQTRRTGKTLLVNKVLIYVSEHTALEAANLYPGSYIQASGNLTVFSCSGNPGQFDEFSYYKSNNIEYVMWAERIELLEEAAFWERGLFAFRERLREVYFQLLPAKEAGTLAAMVLGEKKELPEEVKRAYQQAGIGHLLAISGLHISIVAMTVYRGILLFKGSRRMAAITAMVALLAYGALTGFSISASRAVIMLFLALLAETLGRAYDRETALAFSAIWILAGQPGQLFQSGFLLSFGAVLGAGSVFTLLKPLFLPETRASAYEKSKLSEAVGKGLAWLRQAVLFQVAVSLVTLPILLWFYYEIPVYGMVLNIFLVPLMALITGGGLLAGALGIASPALGRFFLGGVWFLLRLYEEAAMASLRLPFSIWNPGQPSKEKLLLYALGLLASLYCLQRKGKEKRSLACMEIVLLLCFLMWPQDRKGLEITFLEVGQGDGIFLSCEEGISCMIDGGSSSEKQLGEYCLQPFLKHRGEKRLDYIFVSHIDEDHISGVRYLLEMRWTKCLVLPRDLQGEKRAEELTQLAKKKGIAIWWIQVGEGIEKGDFRLYCLAPKGIYNGTNENASSLVLLLEYQGFRGLFTGDLEQEGEKALLENGLPVCTLLKVAHHGSEHSTSRELLEQVQPELAVISCARKNPYGHPGKELLARLSQANCRTLITAESGAVRLYWRKGELVIEEFKKEKNW